MSKVYSAVEGLIGNTPLVELAQLQKKLNLQAKIFAKLEYFNPGGSAKDRVAKSMLDEAERLGALQPNSVIIEPTSGNTGIGLAMVAETGHIAGTGDRQCCAVAVIAPLYALRAAAAGDLSTYRYCQNRATQHCQNQ